MNDVAQARDGESFFDLFMSVYNRPETPTVVGAYRMAARIAHDRGLAKIPLSRIRKTLREMIEADSFRSLRRGRT